MPAPVPIKTMSNSSSISSSADITRIWPYDFDALELSPTCKRRGSRSQVIPCLILFGISLTDSLLPDGSFVPNDIQSVEADLSGVHTSQNYASEFRLNGAQLVWP